ncbi:MAG: pseudouridine synthase [Holophagaceae bacterium]
MAGKPSFKRGPARPSKPAKVTKPAKVAKPAKAAKPPRPSKPARGAKPARPRTARPEATSAPAAREAARSPVVRRAVKPAPRRAAPAARPASPARPRSGRPAEGERLQKILAHAGIDSRRKCEELILEGRVHVNGVVVTELGAKADPRRDEITVDFVPIARERPVYILLNKPKGYVTTVKDEQGRPTVMALLHGIDARVYPVGRLDFNSEGLLLMTNDGALANRLMAPDHEIPKVYLVKVHRLPTKEQLDELRGGFRLDGRRLKPCAIEFAEKGDNPWLRVTLTEGKNQQIRRMFAAIGHPVSKLRRVQFGPLADPALKPGEWRFLSPQEQAAITSL